MPTLPPIPPECEKIISSLWPYLDRELDAAALEALDAHLAGCAPCLTFVAFERRLIEQIHAVRLSQAGDAALRERVLELLRHARAGAVDS